MAGRNGLGMVAGLCLLPLLVAADEPEPLELAPGLQRMEALTEEGEHEEALKIGEALLRPDPFSSWRRDLELDGSRVIAPTLEVVDPALEWFGLGGRGPAERAAVHYARGVVQLAAEDPEAARLEFESARVSAGAGALRLDASYNLGTTVLALGEAAYQEIPEVAAAAGGGGLPPGAAPPGAASPAEAQEEQEEEDPLEKARKIYLEAKDLLVDRLRLDWRDEDTRANVELVMRRLRQLDEIERQREERQQEQQDQDQEQDEQEQDEQEQDEQQENGDPQDQENQQDSEQEGEREEPRNSEQDPSEEEQEAEEQQGEPQERYLTKEEVQRLLDMLEEYEEKGEKALEQRRQGRQRRTERDW